MPYAYCDFISNKDIVSKPAITSEDEFFYIAESKIGKDEDVEEGCEPETVILLVQKEQYMQAEDLNKKTLTSCIKKMLKAAATEKKKTIDDTQLKEWQKKVQDKFLDIVNNHFDEYSYYVRDIDDVPDGCFVIFAKWNESADGVTFYYFKDCLYEQKF